MLRLISSAFLTLCVATPLFAQDPSKDLSSVVRDIVGEVQSESFHGFDMLVGKFDGVTFRIVKPETVAPGHPWVWRARFWGHQPAFDVAMLKRGWHVCYCDVADLFGSQTAVKRWNEFYEFTGRLGLHREPFLEGMSRGGLIVMRWASANSSRVGGVYVDNAVMDFRSWPGGKGSGPGAAAAWKKCLEAYGLTETQSESFSAGPLDQLKPLVTADVPIFALINEADEVVPPPENGDLLVKKYQNLGGRITVLRRPGLGHHPHGLPDPTPLVDFATDAIEKGN